ncbi:EF-hand calcium-binding domain-containing protein 4B [Oryzias latipes]|uniref:EF-hand domain-containing protein n=1 Tax=Oryzias latipes TaxID=8090 RepID=A0A3B3II44_ORYLA|nr:EF-hand calcium-binding domain-containing protein 4B [Oryzias latipes]XP_020559936.1 EF-hand calcium-binding domain-containing protein 4B [Oryzias latipes]
MSAFTSHASVSAAAGRQTQRRRRESGEKMLQIVREKSVSGDLGQDAILEKIPEFFQMCDLENKGFINRRDMQRLNGELPLSENELENVFDCLDSDSNGFLTLEEFSSGFSAFLHGQSVDPSTKDGNPCKILPEVWEEGPTREDEYEEEEHFSVLMERLGANNAFEDPAEVRSLWAHLRRDEPQLLSNFEDFLARVTSQIMKANQEKKEMECALEKKAAKHDDEIQHLYEEMEQQIKNEQDRIVLQDYERFLSRSRDLELQLSNKEKELEQLFQKQRKLEFQCQELHGKQHVTKVENMKLKQSNGELERELQYVSQKLMFAQEQLELLQEQSSKLHEEKEMEVYRVTEGLHRDRASLLKQLDLLREMNKHLRDERDMVHHKPKNSLRRATLKQRPSVDELKVSNAEFPRSEDEEAETRLSSKNASSQPCLSAVPGRHLRRIISIEEDHLPHLVNYRSSPNSLQESDGVDDLCSEEMEDFVYPNTSAEENGETERQMPTSPRVQPVGKETSINEESAPSAPDRLFKVVLVGNSSVGKTCFLRRFCDDCFHPGTCATVGVDYSVKTLTVDNSQVALQLWDTAGQERYRSITKQFFRKADGVVVMYDITAEQSFTAVRQWLSSVKESANEEIPIMLLGNKTDKEMERKVEKKMGERLAKDCQLSVFECSAYSGENVLESMVHLARILKKQEDQEKEKTVLLVGGPSARKRSCC